jgi:hypothetical protein
VAAGYAAKDRILAGYDGFTVDHADIIIGAYFNAQAAAVAFFRIYRDVSGLVGTGGWDWHNL